MTFRKTLSFLLTVSLALAPLSNASAAVNNTERYVFLNSLADKVEVILRANISQLSFVKKCFDGYNHPDCKSETQRIRENIRLKYGSVKHHVFLYNLFDKLSVRDIFSDYRLKNYGFSGLKKSGPFIKPIKKVLRSTASPLSLIEALSSIPDYQFNAADIGKIYQTRMPKIYLKSKKTEKIEKEYNYTPAGLLEYICDQGYLSQGKAPLAKKTYLSDSPKFCSKMNIKFNQEKGLFVFTISNLTEKDYQFLLFLEEYTHSNRAVEQIERRFYSTISDMPYVALVRSINPSNKELSGVFELMIKNARKELSHIRKTYDQAFNGKFARPSAGQVLKTSSTIGLISIVNPLMISQTVGKWLFSKKSQQPKEDQVNINWYKAHSFLIYKPIADSLVEKPTEMMDQFYDTNFDEVHSDVEKSFGNEQMWDVAAELGIAIGSTAICMAPVRAAGGAAIKTIRAFIMAEKISLRTVVCVPTMNLLVNFYFINSALNTYNDFYRRAFSTLEGQQALVEMREMSDAEFNVIIEAVLFPLGVVSIKSTAKVISKLSSKSRSHIMKVVQAANGK